MILGGGEQVGQRARIVREVAVDLDEVVVAAFEPPGEPRAVRATETALAGALEHVDLAELRSDRVRPCARAVGAAVVDDEDVTVGHDFVAACAASVPR